MPSTPRADNDDDVIDIAMEPDTPAHSGPSGGDMQRETGALDGEKSATGNDPQPTSVKEGE